VLVDARGKLVVFVAPKTAVAVEDVGSFSESQRVPPIAAYSTHSCRGLKPLRFETLAHDIRQRQ
jgi:hypothetical protein